MFGVSPEDALFTNDGYSPSLKNMMVAGLGKRSSDKSRTHIPQTKGSWMGRGGKV